MIILTGFNVNNAVFIIVQRIECSVLRLDRLVEKVDWVVYQFNYLQMLHFFKLRSSFFEKRLLFL